MAIRVICYLLLTFVLMWFAFMFGMYHFEQTQCTDPSGGECDVAVLEGMLWAAVTFVLCTATAVIYEVRVPQWKKWTS